MSDKRATLDFGSDESSSEETISLQDLVSKKTSSKKKDVPLEAIKKVSEQSGFVSREVKHRRTRPQSPYLVQLNLKTKDGVKEIFQEIGARLGVFDQNTFERAITALLEKEKMVDLLREMEDLNQ